MDSNEQYYIADSIQNLGNQFAVAGMKKKDREFAREQSQLSYDRQLEHWNQVNEYNSPTEQMKRFSDAGLNKNLIYGNMANTPASNSVKYQPVSGDTTIPGSKVDNAAYAGLDQQLYFQGKMLEQQVRMNDQILQNMEIKNTNMEADTDNKRADYSLKMLTSAAKSLGIKYDYGVENGVKTSTGLRDYDLSLKRGSVQKLQNAIKLQVQTMSINEQRAWWLKFKQEQMEKYRTNIDKDSSLERKATGAIDWLGRVLDLDDFISADFYRGE